MATALPTILIVDDSATTRAFITRVINMTGVAVGALIQASNGQEALDLMQEGLVSLVLADLNMPVMDGIEMISQMRRNEKWRGIPVVVISAQPDPQVIEQLKVLGVSSYLAKPFTPEGVREVIGPMVEAIARSRIESPAKPAVSFNLKLAEALAEALETMAFMGPEEAESADLHPQEKERTARVEFNGKGIRGSLSLKAPRAFGVAVAKNCAVIDAEGEADDALKELTNVTCGLFLRKRTGGATGFVLSPPVLELENSAPAAYLESDFVVVKADGFVVTACATPEQTSV